MIAVFAYISGQSRSRRPMLRRWASTRCLTTAWNVLSRPNFNRRIDGADGRRRPAARVVVAVFSVPALVRNGSSQPKGGRPRLLCGTVHRRPQRRDADNRYNASATVHRGGFMVRRSRLRRCRALRARRYRCVRAGSRAVVHGRSKPKPAAPSTTRAAPCATAPTSPTARSARR